MTNIGRSSVRRIYAKRRIAGYYNNLICLLVTRHLGVMHLLSECRCTVAILYLAVKVFRGLEMLYNASDIS